MSKDSLMLASTSTCSGQLIICMLSQFWHFGNFNLAMVGVITWWKSTVQTKVSLYQRVTLSNYQNTEGIGKGKYEDSV